MTDRITIHTTINKSTYTKLIALSPNKKVGEGIEKAVAIVEGKELNIKKILIEIARAVLNKHSED